MPISSLSLFVARVHGQLQQLQALLEDAAPQHEASRRATTALLTALNADFDLGHRQHEEGRGSAAQSVLFCRDCSFSIACSI